LPLAPGWIAHISGEVGTYAPVFSCHLTAGISENQIRSADAAVAQLEWRIAQDFRRWGKWSASAILLCAFVGVPFVWGVLLTGGVTVVYSVMGGLWADALTDLSQFIIQLIAGIAMLVAVLHRLGGVSSLWSM
jgi:hypothetical protein